MPSQKDVQPGWIHVVPAKAIEMQGSVGWVISLLDWLDGMHLPTGDAGSRRGQRVAVVAAAGRT